MDNLSGNPKVSLVRTMFGSMKNPGFALFFAHNSLASVDMMVRMAVHGWLILELSDDSAFWVGIYALILGVGQLVFSMFAGALCDRFPPRIILLIEGAIGAFIAFSLMIGTYFDNVNLVTALGVAFIIGCSRATRFTANQRFIYDLVGPLNLMNGISLWRLSITPMVIMGSITAGALIQWGGIWSAYAFLAVSILLSLPFLLLIRLNEPVVHTKSNLLKETLEGIQYAIQNKSLMTLFGFSLVMEGCGFAFLIMIPVMAKNILMVGAMGMGLLQAGVGTGMVLANLSMSIIGDRSNKSKIILVNALLAGIALFGFAVSESLWISIFFATLTMGFLSAYDLTLGALLQLTASAEMRGRAISIHSLAISFTALGGFLMGGIGSIVGVPTTLATAAVTIMLNSIIRRRSILKIRENPR
jgi:MFS family permease